MQEPSSPPDDSLKLVGDQWVKQDGPIMYLQPEGGLTATGNTAVLELVEQVKTKYGRVYLIVDGRKVTEVSAERRAWVAKSLTGRNRPNLLAVVGAAFFHRVMGILVSRLMQFVNPPGLDIRFFSSEEEAKGFIAVMDKGFEGGGVLRRDE